MFLTLFSLNVVRGFVTSFLTPERLHLPPLSPPAAPLPPPQRLQQVSVPIVSNIQCNAAYGTGKVTTKMMCAGPDFRGEGFCKVRRAAVGAASAAAASAAAVV